MKASRRRTRAPHSFIGDVAFAALVALMMATILAFRLMPDMAEASTGAQARPRETFSILAPFAPIGPWARLSRLRDDPAACSAALAETGMMTVPVADRTQGSCGFTNAVTLQQTNFAYSAPLQVSCPVAAAIDVWERDVVGQAAARYLTSPIVKIRHMGSYACRRINHAQSGPMSEHATANAVDIEGFELADGRVITIKADWGKGTPEAAFLNEVRNSSCGVFTTVLSPDYNSLHADHLHLDMGRHRLCR